MELRTVRKPVENRLLIIRVPVASHYGLLHERIRDGADKGEQVARVQVGHSAKLYNFPVLPPCSTVHLIRYFESWNYFIHMRVSKPEA